MDPLCVISRQNIEDEKQKNKRKLSQTWFFCEKMLNEIKKTVCQMKIEILGQLSDVHSDFFWVLGTCYRTDCTLLGPTITRTHI